VGIQITLNHFFLNHRIQSAIMPFTGACRRKKATTPEGRDFQSSPSSIRLLPGTSSPSWSPGARRKTSPRACAVRPSLFRVARDPSLQQSCWRGVLLVLVQLVIRRDAITAPSGILPSSFLDYALITTPSSFRIWQASMRVRRTGQGCVGTLADPKRRTPLVLGMEGVSAHNPRFPGHIAPPA